MIPLNQIEIAKPCYASWDDMAGDGNVRFCTECSRNVYNLSGMTTEQAQTLVMETEGNLCVRFYRRKDGTILTSDCPVGIRIARRRKVAAGSWAVSLVVATVMGTSLFAASSHQATMGAPMAPRPVEQKTVSAKKHAKSASKSKPVVKPSAVKRPSSLSVMMGAPPVTPLSPSKK